MNKAEFIETVSKLVPETTALSKTFDYPELLARISQGPDRWNRSSVERISRAILGPTARTWKVTGGIALGHDLGGKKMELGRGKDYETAFRAVFVDTVRMREDYKKLERGEDVDTST